MDHTVILYSFLTFLCLLVIGGYTFTWACFRATKGSVEAVGKKIDDLPCSDMRERIAKVEQQLENGK